MHPIRETPPLPHDDALDQRRPRLGTANLRGAWLRPGAGGASPEFRPGSRRADVGAHPVSSARSFLDLEEFVAYLTNPPMPTAETWRAELVRLAKGEGDGFRALCEVHHLVVHDVLDRQLEELAIVRVPGTGRERERRTLVADELAHAGDAAACGCWVFFPWAGRVVHVLGPEAFFEVITNRNRDKITDAEQ